MQGIYKITNKEDGKVYIGQSNNVERRIQEHKQTRFVNIDMWINVLGVDKFDFEVLEEGAFSQQELDEKEIKYISQYDSCNKEKGYNIQTRGFNNSAGSGNGRAKLTEEDVYNIRTAYDNHLKCKDVYKEYEDKVSYQSFQAIWQGRTWSHIRPEVYTEENKKWYTGGQNQNKAVLTPEEVLNYRKYYVSHTAPEVYEKFCQDHGKDKIAKTTFQKILTGDVRENSIYKTVPVYKKSLKKWELKGEPVSTIP